MAGRALLYPDSIETLLGSGLVRRAEEGRGLAVVDADAARRALCGLGANRRLVRCYGRLGLEVADRCGGRRRVQRPDAGDDRGRAATGPKCLTIARIENAYAPRCGNARACRPSPGHVAFERLLLRPPWKADDGALPRRDETAQGVRVLASTVCLRSFMSLSKAATAAFT